MAWYSFLTSSTRAVESTAKAGETIVNGLVSGIDALVFTEEEKSAATQKGTETILKFWEAVSKENTEQSIARRMLAKMTFQVFFFFLLAAAVVYKFDVEYAKFLLELAGKIMFLVSAIGLIYFGPHQFSKIVKR
ncbi:hypothetical protein E3J49_00640 [Candidatus Bathyarchaeota archaeon]|nr:MAG: hypothetical protein E3J49_00640 [Candidatus Bathyarchaeota archaeon]